MAKGLKISLLGLVLVFVLMQLVPVKRSNPAVESEVPAPTEIRALLRRACYDCHSNETRWPWYSRIAPVSWLVAHDVDEGREKLNFSTWNRLSVEKRVKKLKHLREEVLEGEMPPWIYLPAHPDARLSDAERTALCEWAAPPALAGNSEGSSQ